MLSSDALSYGVTGIKEHLLDTTKASPTSITTSSLAASHTTTESVSRRHGVRGEKEKKKKKKEIQLNTRSRGRPAARSWDVSRLINYT